MSCSLLLRVYVSTVDCGEQLHWNFLHAAYLRTTRPVLEPHSGETLWVYKDTCRTLFVAASNCRKHRCPMMYLHQWPLDLSQCHASAVLHDPFNSATLMLSELAILRSVGHSENGSPQGKWETEWFYPSINRYTNSNQTEKHYVYLFCNKFLKDIQERAVRAYGDGRVLGEWIPGSRGENLKRRAQESHLLWANQDSLLWFEKYN